MNDQTHPNYWRKQLEAIRKAQLDASPKRAIHKAQDRFSQAVTRRLHIDRLISQHNAEPGTDPSNLDQLNRELNLAIREVEGAQEAGMQAAALLQSETDEARVEGVPLGFRQETLSLLAQEREAIEATHASARFTAGEFGAIGGSFFGLEGRMSQARKDGDAGRCKQLKPQLEAARAKKEEAEAEMNEIQKRIAQIKAEYNIRISALGGG